MKILKIGTTLTVVLNDGSVLTDTDCSEEKFNDVYKHQEDEEYILDLMSPVRKEIKEKQKILLSVDDSHYLSRKGDCVIMSDISGLTLPESLMTAFLEAEANGDTELIQTYRNFWTLCSLNPDSRARTNLFWFLQKYGMTISKSGLFIAYRNVDVKSTGSDVSEAEAAFISDTYTKVKFKWKKSPSNYFISYDEDDQISFSKDYPSTHSGVKSLQEAYEDLAEAETTPVYTDQRTGKMEIRLGKMVSMPREDCDAVQENTCSSGLHVAGKDWAHRNYFGSTQLLCLVNPADVVAVPYWGAF